MTPVAYITTSWDDGHPLDFRVAELLAQYGLPGTFYVPRVAEQETMTPGQVRELSRAFEIGAHTLNHVVLTGVPEQLARQEIVDARSWLESSTGLPCRMFCPPKGKYSTRHLGLVAEAGYVGLRSVELLSLAFPRPQAGIMLMPTTVQAHPHGLTAYAKNAIKRRTFTNFWRYLGHRSSDWTRVARFLLGAVLQHGGVFHLWGHSWELEQTGQWQQLEEVLRFMGQAIGQAAGRTNGQLCEVMARKPVPEMGSGVGDLFAARA